MKSARINIVSKQREREAVRRQIASARKVSEDDIIAKRTKRQREIESKEAELSEINIKIREKKKDSDQLETVVADLAV